MITLLVVRALPDKQRPVYCLQVHNSDFANRCLRAGGKDGGKIIKQTTCYLNGLFRLSLGVEYIV